MHWTPISNASILRCDFCRSTTGGLQIPLPTGLSRQAQYETNFNFPAPPFNHISGICRNLADTWPAATRVLSRGRERTLGTRLELFESARQTTVIWKRWVYVLLRMENIYDNVTIIRWFPCPSFLLFKNASEYMKDHIFELRRKIWRYHWSSQLYTQLNQLWH